MTVLYYHMHTKQRPNEVQSTITRHSHVNWSVIKSHIIPNFLVSEMHAPYSLDNYIYAAPSLDPVPELRE